MRQQSAYTLLFVGLWIRLLHADPTIDLPTVQRGIARISKSLTRLELNVSQKAFEYVEDFVKGLDASAPTRKLSSVERIELSGRMQGFETVIAAEAKTRRYFVTVPRRYNTEFLLSKPEQLFRDTVFERMPEMARYDFAEACQCLVFGRATAAAFHALRATEGVLKQFYLAHVKRRRLKHPMWAGMVDELKARKRDRPPDVLLESLDLIRRSYRNPTSHPEIKYDLQEAEDLLGLCIDAVNKMVTPAPS